MSAPARPVPIGRSRRGGVVALVHPRSVLVVLALAVAGALLVLTGLGLGDYPLSIPEVVRVLAGGGTRLETRVVVEWRLARELVGLAVGLAFGVAGALTQNVARNALASPNVLGISMGSSAAAVVVIATGTTGALVASLAVPVATLAGGLATAATIYLLSRRDGIDPYRLVLIGLGVNAFLGSVVTFVLVRADLSAASRATVWLTGSLAGRSWGELVPLLVVLAVVGAALVPAAFDLRPLALGHDGAAALGVDVARRQRALLLAAVALTAVSVAAAGPIGFVAFVAPQIARLLCKVPSPPLVGSAACGAVLVLAADLVARSALPWEVPVGVVTAAVGGPFLLYVIVRTDRRATL